MKLAIIVTDGFLELKNKGRLNMDVKGCKGCNAKKGKKCWSAYLDNPTPIDGLDHCPDPILDLFTRSLDCIDNLINEIK